MQIKLMTRENGRDAKVMETLAKTEFQLTVNGAELLIIAQLLETLRGPDTSYARYAPSANDCLRHLTPFWSGGGMPILVDQDAIVRARGIP